MVGARIPLLLLVALFSGDQGTPLRVIRSTPSDGVADPSSEISVSFDRPVAGTGRSP